MFIVADAATFAALLFAYGYVRVANPDWTRPFAFWPTIANGIVMTAVLLTSSLTMVGAVIAAQSGRKAASLRWLGVTMLLGGVFAVLHLREWAAMIGEGWRLSRNEAVRGRMTRVAAYRGRRGGPDVRASSSGDAAGVAVGPGRAGGDAGPVVLHASQV